MTDGEKTEITWERSIDLLSRTMGFEGLGRSDLGPLAEKGYGLVFPKGAFIFNEGAPADTFHVVAQGRVKLYKMSSSGRSLTAVLAGPGSTLNAVVLFENRPRFLSARALDQVELLCIPGQDFIQFARDNSKVAVNIIRTLGRIIENSYERLLDQISEKVEQRILNMLLTLYTKFGSNLVFTAAELAELAGTTTETTLRIMSRLRELDIVDTTRGRIKVIDPEHLERLGRGAAVI